MRTLQKLQHVTPPDAHHVRRIRNAERRSVARRERRTWHLRLVRLALWVLVPVGLGLVGFRLWSLRLVADGLARANVVTTVAPARARVTAVFVEPGQTVQRGDALAELEALDRDVGLRPRELALDEALLRLAVVEAGGDLGENDLDRRAERLADAERRIESARAAAAVARAELAVLGAERAELVQRIEQSRHARDESVARIETALAAARGEIAVATARQGLLDFDARWSEDLVLDGVSTERRKVLARSELAASEAEIDGIAMTTVGLEKELRAVHRLIELEEARGDATLAAMDARIASAEQTLVAVELEQRQWTRVLARRRALAPDARVDGAELRALELELARTAVERARAELASYDRELGHGVLVAAKAGRVDRVFVRSGAIVDAGEPITRTFDPSDVEVLAWVDPARVDELEVGAVARIVPAARRGTVLEGRIASIDDVWSLAPDQLPHLQANSGSFMVPVVVGDLEAGDRAELAPNMRVQVVFRTAASVLTAQTGDLELR